MIQPFNKYVEDRKVRKGSPDLNLAKSMLNRAQRLLEYSKKTKPTEEICDFIFEDAYEAARESVQAIMAAKGYKPYSHEATIAFAKEFYPQEFDSKAIAEFDRFRKLRNDAKYRAIKVDIEDAKDVLAFAQDILKKAIIIID